MKKAHINIFYDSMKKHSSLRSRKAEKRPKIHFSLYRHSPNGSSLLTIWETATFFFWQLFPVVAGTWLGLRSESFFFAQNFRFSARKSVFWYGTAIFVNGPFVALIVAVVLAPSDNFLTFRFRVMAFFVASRPKNGHFWHVSLVEGSTLNFGPN